MLALHRAHIFANTCACPFLSAVFAYSLHLSVGDLLTVMYMRVYLPRALLHPNLAFRYRKWCKRTSRRFELDRILSWNLNDRRLFPSLTHVCPVSKLFSQQDMLMVAMPAVCVESGRWYRLMRSPRNPYSLHIVTTRNTKELRKQFFIRSFYKS